MLSRRRFLQTSSIVSLSPVLPTILGSTARAASSGSDEKVLVVIQLDGGNDGINTVVPHGDDVYGKVRSKLRLEPKKLLKLDDHIRLHPNMRAAKELFDDGRLSIVQGVGYPNPDRSHFRSMKIWQTASFDDTAHNGYGWLGRALDQQAQSGRMKGTHAIYVGEQETPVALWGRRSSATSLSRTEDMKLMQDVSLQQQTRSNPAAGEDDTKQFVTKQLLSAYAAADEFERQELSDASAKNVNYPGTQLASRLRLISKLLKSGSYTRVFYTAQSGYDTHSAQLYTHSRLLREFSDAVKAFLDDLKAAKLDDQVVVLAFSEFGRRVQENDSQGTDHGAAGPVFLAGTSLIPGLHGMAPDLSDLDDGDLKMQVDFRSLYSTILEDWLGVDSSKVLEGSFERFPLLKA